LGPTGCDDDGQKADTYQAIGSLSHGALFSFLRLAGNPETPYPLGMPTGINCVPRHRFEEAFASQPENYKSSAAVMGSSDVRRRHAAGRSSWCSPLGQTSQLLGNGKLHVGGTGVGGDGTGTDGGLELTEGGLKTDPGLRASRI
jgi:hypothetical protein